MFVRSVAALLVLDLLGGIWLHLHAPEIVPVLSVGNLAAVSLGGVFGLLPDQVGETIKGRVVSQLQRRGVARALWGATLALLGVSLFFSSVTIQSNGASTRLLVVRGSQERSVGNATSADTIRLDRSTAAAHRIVPVAPLGTRVWLRSGAEVTHSDQPAVPWLPVRWSYPDDFDSIAVLYVLPLASAVTTLSLRTATFVLTDADGDTLARGVLRPAGLAIRLPDSLPSVEDIRQSRYDELKKIAPGDSPDFDARLDLWQSATYARARRPLHRGERVRYVLSCDGGTTRTAALNLRASVTDLMLDSTDVRPVTSCAASR